MESLSRKFESRILGLVKAHRNKANTTLSLVVLLLVQASACGVVTGDTPSIPDENPYGNGQSISDLAGEATWYDDTDMFSEDCDIPSDDNVDVTGVSIVAIDRFDETGEGAVGNYYVQDAVIDEPYSGMTVYSPSFNPPDLRLAAGDIVDISGVFTEFIGPSTGYFGYCKTLPELSGVLRFRFEQAPLEPTLITTDDLRSYESARPYLGMLVRLENVTLLNEPENSSGRYTADISVGGGIEQADIPSISNELYDLETEGPTLSEGQTFTSVTGVLTYFYNFHIAPRSPADFEM